MNRLLMLIQLDLIGAAHEARYARQLRAELTRLGDYPHGRGLILAPAGSSSLRR